MSIHSYDDRFFAWVDRSAERSAVPFVKCVCGLLSPNSVLDVGCGRGMWLKVWQSQDCVRRVLGVDGDGADPPRMSVSRDLIRPVDLEAEFTLGERFDLAQCLEVAEHLSSEAAPRLIRSLVRHGDIVVFSAASPGQGGEHHINEQEPEYWRQLFASHGFQMYDAIRPRIANERSIDAWYRYNAFLYAPPEIALRFKFDGSAVREPGRPRRYDSLAWRARKMILRRLPTDVVTRLSRVKYRIMNRLSDASPRL